MAAIEQNIEVKGQVVDTNGDPIIGANILVKGTNNGVISDIDGNFQSFYQSRSNTTSFIHWL